MVNTLTTKLGMNKQIILINKNRSVLVPRGTGQGDTQDPRALTFQAEVMRLGFIMDQHLLNAVSKLSDIQIEVLYGEVTHILSNLVGDDVVWTPMYTNFPQQVFNATDSELFFNAMIHYWTHGQWSPRYTENARLPAFEATKFKALSLGSDDDVKLVFTSILGSNASVSEFDKSVVSYLMTIYSESELAMALPQEIPFKEQLCAFVSECIEKNFSILGMAALKTATDILRVATHISGGDISLAENCKFKSMKRSLRRGLIEQLDKVINEDDIARYRTRWVTLAHSLHIGEYSKVAPKVFRILSNARDKNYKFRSFDSRVEAAITKSDSDEVIKLLSTRPGNFSRRLDHVMRLCSKQEARDVAKAFIKIADKVDTRVLLQLYGHFKVRTNEVAKRLVFPKGKVAKGMILRDILPAQGKKATSIVMTGIEDTLKARFAKLSNLGKVFIDPSMKDCVVPLSLRSASDGLDVVGRGTKIALTDKKTLRLFIYWVGKDIDLSAAAYSEDFSKTWQVSYTNLREAGIKSCHSGDIVNAPKGAAEFIDVDIASALKAGARYVVMQVYVFNGPTFAEHKKCYAGWMTRNNPDKNAIFDPKTVEQKIDVQSDSRTAIPVIFDLKERKAIWLDMATADRGLARRINSFESNKATLVDLLEGALSLNNKPTLYDLFTMHASARGEIVDNIEDAEMVFSWDGNVRPTDANVILSEYLS